MAPSQKRNWDFLKSQPYIWLTFFCSCPHCPGRNKRAQLIDYALDSYLKQTNWTGSTGSSGYCGRRPRTTRPSRKNPVNPMCQGEASHMRRLWSEKNGQSDKIRNVKNPPRSSLIKYIAAGYHRQRAPARLNINLYSGVNGLQKISGQRK